MKRSRNRNDVLFPGGSVNVVLINFSQAFNTLIESIHYNINTGNCNFKNILRQYFVY